MKVTVYWTAALMLAIGFSAQSQDMTGTPTPLATLVSEAQSNNTQLSAAEHAWKAATHVAVQVTTLPDPQLTLQSFSVGSPKPFAGFSNSDFAYIGFGASQQIPYRGKLRLKGEVASRDADMLQTQAELLRTSIIEQVKLLYLRIAYLDATLTILGRNEAVLKPLIETGLSRYRVGQGSQAEVLKAQIEHTKLLRELTMHHQEMGQLEAELKELLHRPQTSADIVPEPLSVTRFERTVQDVQGLIEAHNPTVAVDTAGVHKQDAQLKSAQRESRPDFNVGYMFQQTGGGYRDYYVLTFSMNLPQRKRVNAGIAQAAEALTQSKQQLDSEVQQQLAEGQKQYVAVRNTEDLLKEYREGLLPQSKAALQAEQASYESGKQTFAPVLSSLLDELTFEHDYYQAVLDHETGLVKLETLTGAQLR